MLALQGMRMGVLALVYFQYVVKRNRTNFMTKQAVTLLTDKAGQIFHHKWCPRPVGAAFDGVKKLVAKAASFVKL